MKLDKLTGTWEGFYTYSDDYQEELQFTKEHFVLELKVNGEVLEGTIVDSYIDKYFKEPATVWGYLDHSVLTLIKKYPHAFELGENGEIFLDPSKPSHEIHMAGTLTSSWFSKRYFVEGSWDISGSFIDEEGNSRYYTWEGEWEMQRKY